MVDALQVANLRAEIARRGLTYRAIAQRLKVNRESLSHALSGRRPKTLERIWPELVEAVARWR